MTVLTVFTFYFLSSCIFTGVCMSVCCLTVVLLKRHLIIANLITSRTLFTPKFLQRSSLFHASGLDDSRRIMTDIAYRKWRTMHPNATNISNGHISANGSPIHSMFGSRVVFSGTADLMAPFLVRKNPTWQPPQSWKNFKWPYLRNRSSDQLRI